MVLRKKQAAWIDRIKKEHPSFHKFIKAPVTEKSKESYAYKIQRFMKFTTEKAYTKHPEDFESLLQYDTGQITDILEEFVDYLELDGLVYEAVKTTLAAPELFFDMNRKFWHKKLVHRGMARQDRIQGGRLPVTNEDLQAMLQYCDRSLRKQVIIHLLSTLGMRPGALIDPVLKIKHLVSLPNPANKINQPYYCYAIRIYDQSKEGYWGFINPEARKILDKYLKSRERDGEKIDGESPLLSTLGSRWNTKNNYLTDENMKNILEKIIKGAKIERKKTGNRFDKSLTYMFRKRFNTIMKIDNTINSNIAEKLMAHKNGLDGTYLAPTMEECYTEFVKAIPELTIDPTERQRIKIEKLEEEKSENKQLLERVADVEKDLKLFREIEPDLKQLVIEHFEELGEDFFKKVFDKKASAANA